MGATPVRVDGSVQTTMPKKSRLRVPLARAVRRVLPMGVVSPIHHRSADGGNAAPPTLPPDRPGTTLGDPDFDAFYRLNYPTVTRLAYSLCGSLTVAEELAQESFVAAHDRWRRIAAFDRPDLWVRRVVINRSLSYRRRVASERRALLRVSSRRNDANEPQLADEEVWQAVRELSGRQAEVLALVYVEDRPIAEVAEILHLGEETVRTHLKRGRAALAAKLARTHEDVG